MLSTLGYPLLSIDQVTGFIGQGVRELVRDCIHSDDLEKIEMGISIYRQFYAEHLLDHSRLFPGAQKVLHHFRERSQAVITNKPNPYSREILEGLGIAHYFLRIIGGDIEFPKKPDPASILSLIEKTKVTPQEALFIGDSPVDVQAGRNAGVFTIVVAHGFSGPEEIEQAHPDKVVSHFGELFDWVQSQGW